MRFGTGSGTGSGTGRRRAADEGIVPMINVVFLLLVFLLLTAELDPAPPVEVAPPLAAAEAAGPAPEDVVLYLAADGTLALGALRGPAALAAVPGGATVWLRADAAVPAADLAALLPALGAAGEVRLVTVPP